MAAIARVPEEMMLNVPCELQKYRLLQIECSQMFSTMYRKNTGCQNSHSTKQKLLRTLYLVSL